MRAERGKSSRAKVARSSLPLLRNSVGNGHGNRTGSEQRSTAQTQRSTSHLTKRLHLSFALLVPSLLHVRLARSTSTASGWLLTLPALKQQAAE